MRLRSKMMLAPALSAVLLVAVMAVSLWMSHTSIDAVDDAHVAAKAEHAQSMQQLNKLAALHTELYRAMVIIASMDDKAVKSLRDRHAGELSAMSTQLAKQANEFPASEPAKATLTRAAGLLQKYRKAADSAVDLATVDPNTGVAAMQSADAEFKVIAGLMEELQTASSKRGDAKAASAQASADQTAHAIIAIGLLASVFSMVFAWVTQRRLVAQMVAGSQAAQRVAQGHLDQQPTSTANDEVGDLMRALGGMVGQLRSTIHSVLQVSDSIGTASSEIASGNQDLSQRTEQTASSLQETASSMEQLTGTVRHSAESAATANQLATSAAQVAQRGGEVVALSLIHI